MKEIEYRIIAGILPDVLTRIEVASGMSLTRDNFSDKYASLLWKFISEYYDDHAQIIPLWVLKNKAEKIGLDNGTILTLAELYEGLSEVSVEQHEFKESIKLLKEQELAEKTAEALTTGREILIEGVYDDKNDRTLKGQEDARDYVAEALQELQSYNTDAAPEGDMRDDMEKIWVTYISKEENPDEAGGILYGIEDVDNVTNGIRPGELVLVAGFTGVGKASPLWTKVLTPTGWITIGELEKGSRIVDPLTGLPQEVEEVHDRGTMKTYRVNTRDGGSVLTAADHLWRVQTQYQKDGKSLGDQFSVLTTEQIMHGLSKGRRYYLPVNAPVEFSPSDPLPIGAYALGVLLGDGGTTVDVRITSNKEDEQEILTNFSQSVGIPHKIVPYSRGTVAVQGEEHGDTSLRDILRSLGVACKSVDKRIPSRYLTASIDDRLSLLRGLMDTDGTVSHNGCPEFSTSSVSLMEDVRDLIHSLGGVTGKIRSKVPFYRNIDGERVPCTEAYTIGFRLPDGIIPFSLERKAALVKPSNRSPYRVISSVTEEGEEEVRCITVSGSDHLYITEDYLVTHNSHTLVNIARNTMLAGKNVLMFTTETTREEMEIRIIARHSREPKFKVPGGLDSHEIMSGTLSSENKEALREVLKDFKSVDGGRLFMVQMPANGSVDYVYTKANQYNRKAPIDIILIDSINLLRASRRYDSKREMLEDMLQAFKRFASSFDNGRGVAIVSPWQMSRAAWKEASDAGGVYTLASLSDTSEAEKCLTPETKVLTPRGWKDLGDIEVGDVINDPTGGVQEVITVNDNGRRPLYEVFTRDGMKVTTSPGHIWTVSKDGYHFEDLTTVDIMEGLESGVAEYILPAMQPTQVDDAVWFEQQMYNLPIDFMVEALKNTEVCEGELVIPTRDPEMLTEFIATVPKYGMVTDPSDTLIRYHYPIMSLERERTIQCIMEANLFSGNHSEFRIPEYYMALPDYLRIYFLEKFLGLKEGEVDLYDPEQASKYLHLLPYDHPGYGDTLMDMVHSLGLTPDGRPRSITAVKSTGMDDRVMCLTVSEPHGLFIVEGMIVTHNSASQILTLYKDGTDESPKLNVQVLKNRSGREMSKVSYPVDFRNSYFDTSGQTSSSNKSSPQSRTRGAVDFTQFMG